MNEDLHERYNDLNIRLVRLESQGDHHSTRIIEFREKHTDLDGKIDRLSEYVNSSTKEILSLVSATQTSIQSLRAWFIGITAGAAAVFAAFELFARLSATL